MKKIMIPPTMDFADIMTPAIIETIPRPPMIPKLGTTISMVNKTTPRTINTNEMILNVSTDSPPVLSL